MFLAELPATYLNVVVVTMINLSLTSQIKKL